jgi:beta-glucosidase
MKFQLFLDDSVVVRSVYAQRNGEFPDPRPVQSASMQLDANRSYRIRVEAQETYGDAQLQLILSVPHEKLEAEAVSAAQQADAVVMVLGLTARLEGEEMPVAIEGFTGGDRTRIDLPAAQQRLLERIVAVGKPTVLVLLNGSAVAVNWAQDHVPAIVEGWYPGQAGGTALAEVLFGDYNPAGLLSRHDRPAAVRELRHEGPHVSLLRGKAALSLRPRVELHDVRLQEAADEHRDAAGQRCHHREGRRHEHR